MFRKAQEVSERSRSALKSKEVRKLKADLLQRFPLLEEAHIDELLPNKTHVVCIKLANRTLIYCLGQEGTQLIPIFFDVEGRSNFYPTVYALWRLPNMLRPVYVHTPVSEFIFNGADLMLPGVVGEISPVLRGEKRCIIARGNPKPFAVGDMLIDDEYLATKGRKGKGLHVVHAFGDLLWELGDKAFPEGFSLSGVERIAQPLLVEGESAQSASDEDEKKEEIGTEGAADAGQHSEGEAAADHAAEANLEAGMDALDIDDGGHGEAVTADTESEEKEAISSGEETAAMDDLIVATFLRAAKYTVKDRQLPMLASTFYASYMLPARPEGTVIDLKRSSFKKVTAFLEEMARKKLLTLQNNNGVVSITSINRNAEDYRLFRTEEADAIRAAVEEAHSGGKKEDASHQYRILDLFKLPRPMREAFGDAHGQYGEYLNGQEARSIIMTYVAANNLEDPTNKRFVRLDPLLSHLLFKKRKDPKSERRAAERERQDRQLTDADFPALGAEQATQTSSGTVTSVTKEELVMAFMSKLSKYYAIESNAFMEGIRIGSGPIPTIDIIIEARQGNKVVTRVTGLEAFGIPPDQFAKDCQKRFACSAVANQVTGQKHKEVTIQGHLAQELEGWFPSRYGLPARFLSATVRKGVKPKKKAR